VRDGSGDGPHPPLEPMPHDDETADVDDETAGADDEGAGSDMFRAGGFLPEPMSGQDAIDALGDDLERVAEMNNRTPEELRELLLRDKTLHVSPNGFLMYVDTATPHSNPSE
jgi:hypothetical protein